MIAEGEVSVAHTALACQARTRPVTLAIHTAIVGDHLRVEDAADCWCEPRVIELGPHEVVEEART